MMQFDYKEYSEGGSPNRCNAGKQSQETIHSKQSSTVESADSFHSSELTKPYNRMSNEKLPGHASDLSRQSDHVSCEDLLEFACDGPNTRRTRGPRNGEQSDEVRIDHDEGVARTVDPGIVHRGVERYRLGCLGGNQVRTPSGPAEKGEQLCRFGRLQGDVESVRRGRGEGGCVAAEHGRHCRGLIGLLVTGWSSQATRRSERMLNSTCLFSGGK